MTQEEYCLHLDGQLCWRCHCSTHASHARQRQCPQCRKKWSYARRQLEWSLAELFCQALNAHHASLYLDIAYGTARSHFRRFALTLRPAKPRKANNFLLIRDRLAIEKRQKAALSLLFNRSIKQDFFKVPGHERYQDSMMIS